MVGRHGDRQEQQRCSKSDECFGAWLRQLDGPDRLPEARQPINEEQQTADACGPGSIHGGFETDRDFQLLVAASSVEESSA